MDRPSLLLLFPPGWNACVSGPYAAGPYLQGFVRQAGFGCRWVDLNRTVSNRYTRRIEVADAIDADHAGLAGCNALYFDREADLQRASDGFEGNWTLQDGYQPLSLDPGSSESVRRHLDAPAPYDAFLTETIATLLDVERPSFVGLSIAVPQQLFGAFRTAAIVRRLAPDIPVILGGNMPTRLIDEMALPWVFDHIDILATNQGEETCVSLLEAGPAPDRWAAVPNIRYRDESGIRRTDKRLLARENFGRPDFAGIDFDEYWGFPYATLMGSRGCYYGKCPFCAIPFAWGDSGFRGHDSPDAVFDVMRSAVEKHGVSRFKFVEESMHAPSVRRLADLILESGLDMCWEGYVRMDRPWFDRAFLDRASRAGLRKVYVGLEILGGDGRILLGKHDKPAAGDFLARLKEAGILAHVFVMVGHPGTGIDEAMETVAFALDHRELIDTLEISGFRYEKHTSIDRVTRFPDPARDWALDDDYRSDLVPTLGGPFVDQLERELFTACGLAVPHWTHPVHHMVSPWARARIAPPLLAAVS